MASLLLTKLRRGDFDPPKPKIAGGVMADTSKAKTKKNQNCQEGFTIVQLLLVVALVAVVSALGFMGIRNVRAEMRIQNSARRFAIYLEKARLDSVRRRVAPGAESTVRTFDPGTNNFQVTMDFDGNGTIQTRTFVLDEGVTFITNAQTVSFDWRGRIAARAVFQITNGIKTIPVDVSGSGDVTLGDQRFADDSIGDIALADVPPDVVPDPTPFPDITSPDSDPSIDPTPTPTPNGNGNGNGNGNDNGNPHSSPTPTPEPTPTVEPTPIVDPDPDAPASPCASSVTPGFLSLSQRASGTQSGTVSFTLSNAVGSHNITAVQVGGGNTLSISVSPATLSGSGTAIISITSKEGSGNRGNFTVNISSPTCGAVQAVTVSVGN